MRQPTPLALLIDLDNTVYEYPACQRQGLLSCEAELLRLSPAWKNPQDFSREYNEARMAVAKRIPDHAASHCRRLYFLRLVEKKLGFSDLNLVTKLHDAFWKGYFAAMKPDEGCLATLEKFKGTGIRLAWVTNFTTERQIQKLTQIGMNSLAHFLVTSEEAGADKPSPKPFQLALEKLGLPAQDVCMIGDDWEADIEPATALGMRAIWRKRADSRSAPDKKISVPEFSNWSELNSLL